MSELGGPRGPRMARPDGPARNRPPLDRASRQPAVLDRAALSGNKILDGTSTATRERLLRLGKLRRVEAGRLAQPPLEPILRVLFPVTSLASLVMQFASGETVEAAIIGREGVVGLPLWLGSASGSPMTLIWLVSGEAWELPGSVATDEQFAELRPLVHRYCAARIVELGVQGACNRHHTIRERAARWLLTTADRAARDELALTHQFFSAMLGSHRPRVSSVLAMLARDGLIRQSRGRIAILDREGLMAAACECYAIIRSAYEAPAR